MKHVAVMSGKGGTGKTTITALLAHMASESCRVVVSDADVEASNLPLALRAGEGECEEFPGGFKARIVPELCAACGLCERTCSVGAVVHTDEYTYAIDPLACEGCGACERACQAQAVEMIPGSAGIACTAATSVGAMSYGRLSPGEDLSGKLVTRIREKGDALARSTLADIVLIDGPPGIGCPAIAAVASANLIVAVAEPSLSGAHDLERLLILADQLSIPVSVVLNKCDLSEDGAAAIRSLCAERRISVVGETPFDPEIAGLLEELAAGAEPLRGSGSSPSIDTVAEVWEHVRAYTHV